jgi:hypothetical protein
MSADDSCLTPRTVFLPVPVPLPVMNTGNEQPSSLPRNQARIQPTIVLVADQKQVINTILYAVMGTHSFIRYIVTVTSLVMTVTNEHLQ